jgi:hypothetical protein
VFFVKRETLLARLEEEAFPKSSRKCWTCSTIAASKSDSEYVGLPSRPKKLEDVWLLEDVLRSGDVLSPVNKIVDRFLVSAKCETLVKTCIELAFEISQCPALLGGLDLVKSALLILGPKRNT